MALDLSNVELLALPHRLLLVDVLVKGSCMTLRCNPLDSYRIKSDNFLTYFD